MSSQLFSPIGDPRVALSDGQLTSFAHLAGVLPNNTRITPELLEFALLVMEKCAGIGDLYSDPETGETAGSEIRALFGLL